MEKEKKKPCPHRSGQISVEGTPDFLLSDRRLGLRCLSVGVNKKKVQKGHSVAAMLHNLFVGGRKKKRVGHNGALYFPHTEGRSLSQPAPWRLADTDYRNYSRILTSERTEPVGGGGGGGGAGDNHWPDCLKHSFINTRSVVGEISISCAFFSNYLKCSVLNIMFWWKLTLNADWVTSKARAPLITLYVCSRATAGRGAFQPKHWFNPPIAPSGFLWWAARSLFTPQLSPH